MELIEIVSKWLSKNFLFTVISGFLLSYYITSKILPLIIYYSNKKKIIAKVDSRSSHVNEVPNIGGLGIISGIYFVTLLLSYFTLDYIAFKFVIGLFIPLIVLVFVGFKDDMVGLSAISKLFAEISTAAAFIFLTDLRLDNFYGLFGIYEIDYLFSISLSIFVFVITINSYNLIDGIDGLAGGYGTMVAFFILILCWLNNNAIGTVLCSTIIGSLICFIKFNVNKGRDKIFMGDTGSLVIGFLISVIVMLCLCSKNSFSSEFRNLPVLILSILSLPYIDTLRVMIIRSLNGKRVLEADKNHIHHEMILCGYSHVKSTVLILSVYSSIVIFCLLTRSLDITIHFFVSISYSFASFLVLIKITKNLNKKIRSKR